MAFTYSISRQFTIQKNSSKKTEANDDRCMLTVLEWGHSRNFLKMLMITMMRTTWTMRGEFSLQVNETCLQLAVRFHFLTSQDDRDSHNPMLVHLTSEEMMWIETRIFIHWQKRQKRNQDRKAKLKANGLNSFQEETDEKKVIGVAIHPRQHPRRGGQDTDECRLLTIVDSTADRWLHCIVFSIWRYYHYIYDFYHCHAKLDFGLSDPFLLFFWSTVFSLRPEFLNLAVNSTFHRLGILPEDDFCISHSGAKRICEADFSFFIRHVLRTLVICFDSAFDTFLYSYCCAHSVILLSLATRVHIGISRSLVLTSSTTKRSALLIAFEFVPVFLFCSVP